MRKQIIGILLVVFIAAMVIIWGANSLRGKENINLEKNNITQDNKSNIKKDNNSKKLKNFSAIQSKDFQSLMSSGDYVVIDVRTPEEIARGKVKADALEINFYDPDFREEISKLDKTKKYLINCRSGNRSGKSVQIMKELGFSEVYDLAGGMNAWMMGNYQMNQ